ncbi:MAG: GspE family protein, partial [Bacteroidota bacterium]
EGGPDGDSGGLRVADLAHVRTPVGCDACAGTGYRGRTAVFEVVESTDAFASLVARGASAAELAREARAAGSHTLQEAAVRLMLQGRTSAAEVLRATAG